MDWAGYGLDDYTCVGGACPAKVLYTFAILLSQVHRRVWGHNLGEGVIVASLQRRWCSVNTLSLVTIVVVAVVKRANKTDK